MLGIVELTVAALFVAVAALVLRLRQHEPAAVERLGRAVSAARSELTDAEQRVAALREELARGDEALAPLRAERAALETDVAAWREQAREAEAELATASQALAEQRAQRAEAEAALRDAQVRLAELERERDATRTAREPAVAAPAASAAAPAAALAGRIDLGAVVASSATEEEPSIVRTDGAVRPTDALPPDAPRRAPGEGAS